MKVTKSKIVLFVVVPIVINILIIQYSPILAFSMKHTGSMNPMLEGDDIVFVDRSVSVESIDEGDIVAYKSNCDGRSDMIIHRVVDVHKPIIGKYKLYTKGDNTNVVDISDQNYYECEKPITDSNLVGVYVNHIDL